MPCHSLVVTGAVLPSTQATPVARPDALVRSDVWRASDLPVAEHSAWPTGFEALDTCLPGGGWPCGALTEVLQPPGQHMEWQLLGPALASRFQHARPAHGSGVAWVVVGPPHVPLVSAMQARGLNVANMVCVDVADPAQRLWACEQALRTSPVGAVLAWLPHAPMNALRRLQHAASAHGTLLWAFRPEAAAHQASPAVLRLQVMASALPGALAVKVLKRRGPPLAHTLVLPSPDAGLQAMLAGARWRQTQRRSTAPRQTTLTPAITPAPATTHDPVHALAGTEAHA